PEPLSAGRALPTAGRICVAGRHGPATRFSSGGQWSVCPQQLSRSGNGRRQRCESSSVVVSDRATIDGARRRRLAPEDEALSEEDDGGRTEHQERCAI